MHLDLLEVRPGLRAVALGWPGTLDKLKRSGLRFQVLSQDFGRALAEQYGVHPVNAGPGGAVPSLGKGSLGGFWTYSEVMRTMHNLSGRFPGFVQLDTLGMSLEGRPIVALGLFNNSRPQGSRPEVLFTALTHAREPMSMHTILYFLDHLLQSRENDAAAAYLIDHREVWFVPVVNPDGYVRNERTFKVTGAYGFWRKNTRDNNVDGLVDWRDGVDINRNFGFRWGFDNYGSSPAAQSQVYRGTGPFSGAGDSCSQRFLRTSGLSCGGQLSRLL